MEPAYPWLKAANTEESRRTESNAEAPSQTEPQTALQQAHAVESQAFASLYKAFNSVSSGLAQWVWTVWAADTIPPDEKARSEILNRLKDLDAKIEKAENELEASRAEHLKAKYNTEQSALMAVKMNQAAYRKLSLIAEVFEKLKQIDFAKVKQNDEQSADSENSSSAVEQAYSLRETAAKSMFEKIDVLALALHELCGKQDIQKNTADNQTKTDSCDPEFICSRGRLVSSYEQAAAIAANALENWKSKLQIEKRQLRAVETSLCNLKTLQDHKNAIMQSLEGSSEPPQMAHSSAPPLQKEAESSCVENKDEASPVQEVNPPEQFLFEEKQQPTHSSLYSQIILWQIQQNTASQRSPGGQTTSFNPSSAP